MADWIFELEKQFLQEPKHSLSTILILLYDSNNSQLRLREDGKSLSQGSGERIDSERRRFIEAFDKSLFPLKVKFDLTDYYIDGHEVKVKVDTKSILDKILSLAST